MASFSDIVNGDIPVVIDFYADWCGPCKMMPPILKEVKNELGDQVKVIKINVDTNQALAAKYQVRSIPTIMVFKKGNPVWRQAGVAQAKVIKQAVQLAK
jgi:thioredoxin 1